MITTTKNSLFRHLWIIIIAMIFITCTTESRNNPEEITARALEEFQEMRFGLFIHFGLYAIPAGVWKQDTVPVGTIAEHIMRIFQIPRDEYRQLASEFNPSAFNAKEYVSLAKQAGMNYIVITSKHHDGFAMFASDYDDYNIKDGTPYGKDLLKELSQECKKQGMKLGFYYSHTRDWDEYHSVCVHGNHWDWDKDDPGRDPQVYLDSKVKPQLTELLTNYGEIFCIWFDTPYIISREQAMDLYGHVKNLQPKCLINTRLGQGLGDYGSMGDNQIPPGVVSGVWETPGTMNHSWGYHIADSMWKSSEDLITQLVDLSSKNVNYLLNIGPKADGSIPEESVQRFKEIGEWISKNKEAIYKTGPSPWFQEMDGFRVTTGEDALYLTLLDPGLDDITLYNLNNEIIKIEWLENGKPIPYNYKRLEKPEIAVLDISIPRALKDENLPVIKVSISGIPDVHDQPTQMSTGNVLLQAAMANIVKTEGDLEISGIDGTLDIGNWPYYATRNWDSTKDYLKWDFNIIQPGTFEVQVINVSTVRDIGSHLRKWNSIYKNPQDYNIVSFSFGDQKVRREIKGMERVQTIRSAYRPEFINRLGQIEIREPGGYQAVLQAEFINPNDTEGMVIYEVRLEKIK
jgi:alpha-L-fucosidase